MKGYVSKYHDTWILKGCLEEKKKGRRHTFVDLRNFLSFVDEETMMFNEDEYEKKDWFLLFFFFFVCECYVKRVLLQEHLQNNTNHSEKRSKDDQSDHPESYDNEDRALAVENSSKRYGASYRQISVYAHRGDSKNRGSYRYTCEISNTNFTHIRVKCWNTG